MRTLKTEINDIFDGKRVDEVLKKAFFFGSGRIARLKRRPDGITLNKTSVHVNVRVKKGDVLEAIIEDEPPKSVAPPEDIPLTVVYEDEDIAVIDKQAGLATQGPIESGTHTVASALSHRWKNTVFHPVNRLDKGTSGLMVVAKNGYCHDILIRALHTEKFVRKYLAVAVGQVTPAQGCVDKPIARKTEKSLAREIRADGKASRTEYKTVLCGADKTLLEVTPKTGRTHQIRVHFASIGHPLVGDFLYGEETALIARPALHSFYLSFTHPTTGEELTFSSPLPADIENLLHD